MAHNENMPKHPITKRGPTLTPEQEELLDSGLRILAHMIAETHLKRVKSDPQYCSKLRKRHSTDVAR